MPAQRIVVVGASSGGIEALRTLAASLPSDFPAPLCVVVHTSPQSPGLLDSILTRAGALPAVVPEDRARIRPGRIYVAPPDHHLVVEPGVLRLTKGPRENLFRPAVDPLFRSAAQVYGPGVIGVVLTGNLDDGTAGLWTIKQLGGVAIVQDPDEAMFPSMPRHAIEGVRVDHVVALHDLGPLLVQLLSTEREAAMQQDQHVEVEAAIASGRNAVEAGVQHIGEPSSFACPECHGVLLRMKQAGPTRFRCHTGHAYSAASLAAAVNDGIEDALWSAVRALEEAALLMRHLATHARVEDAPRRANDFDAQADEAHRQSETVRDVVRRRDTLKPRPGTEPSGDVPPQVRHSAG
ncbi:MAG TPA: chemotaxis protein CheB [Vicinamibacterales bacterium]|nr:chemotaxis protein CheB [Vicinamibacterales bacterium]